MSRTTIGWTLAAIAGLLLAAGLTLAVSQLTSQHVGLYDESPDAGRGLVVSTHRTTTAPKARPKRKHAPKKQPAAARTTTTPPPVATAPTPPATTTTDDHGGSGGSGDRSGKGGGHGSDD